MSYEKQAARPRAYVCYLCGAQFGSASLSIHISQCQKKWTDCEQQKPARERRALPPPPAELQAPLPKLPQDIDDFNSKMFAYWDKVTLLECPGCSRTFRPEALEVHARVCKGDDKAQQEGSGVRRDKGLPALACKTPAAAKAATAGLGSINLSTHTAAARKNSGCSASVDSTIPRSRMPSAVTACGTKTLRASTPTVPRTYVCYLCGQQFGSHSLPLHVPRCLQLFEERQQLKAPRERRAPPPPPPELDLPLPVEPRSVEQFNARMMQYYNGAALSQCNNCGRTFRPEALEVHQRSCTADKPARRSALGLPTTPEGLGAAPARGGSASSALRRSAPGASGQQGNVWPAMRPRAYSCYLCGQQYGSQSLSIHVPRCLKLWEEREAAKAPSQRRAPPPPPPALSEPLPTTPHGIDEFNAAMSAAFNGLALVACSHCHRTFTPEALQHHARHCRADAPMKAASSTTWGAGVALGAGGVPLDEFPTEQVELIACSNCGRTFNANALEKHKKVCAKVFKKAT